MIKKINIIILGIISVILLSNLVLAFGVATPYWRGNPLTISPGETATVNLILQNMGSQNDVTVRAKIINGSEIASTEEKDYIVKAGTRDTEVPIKIIIPANISINITYTVIVSSITVASREGGGVALGIGMDTAFDVLVVPKSIEKKETFAIKNLIFLIIAIIIVVLAIVIVASKKKKTASGKV